MRLFLGADEIELLPATPGGPDVPDGPDPDSAIDLLPPGSARTSCMREILIRSEADFDDEDDPSLALKTELAEGRLYVRYGCWFVRETLSFVSERSAAQFLGTLPREGLRYCREILANDRSHGMNRLSDHDVLQLTAMRLLNGTLLAVVNSVVWSETGTTDGGGEAPSASDQSFAPSRAIRAEEPRQRPPEESTFGSQLDPAAMAETKREASRLGIPFCEECNRRAAGAA